jgi:hypothetical protein
MVGLIVYLCRLKDIDRAYVFNKVERSSGDVSQIMDGLDDIFGRRDCLSLRKGKCSGQEEEWLELHDGSLGGRLPWKLDKNIR